LRRLFYVMVIRKYNETELETVFTIYQQTHCAEYFKEVQIADFQIFEGIVQDEEIHVALIGDQIIAFISVYPPQSFVHYLYVLPDFQKRGAGRALLQHIRNIYDSPLSLKCERINKPAIKFYEEMGWKLFDKGSENDGTEYILLTLDFE